MFHDRMRNVEAVALGDGDVVEGWSGRHDFDSGL